MPVDAKPEPWPSSAGGTVHLHHEYLDVLGRPLTGQVTVSRKGGTGAPVPVTVPNGVLDLDLPPGIYQLAATLRTREGQQVTETRRVVLTEEQPRA